MPLTFTRATAGGRAFRPASVILGVIALSAASLVGRHALAEAALADGETRGGVIVQGDHVDPGASFTLTGYDLDEDADVRIELIASGGAGRVELGTATTATDGTLSVELVVPEAFPTGYAELLVLATGASWSTTVLIGDRAEGPGGANAVASTDWLPLVLAVAGLAVIAFALVRFVRAGRTLPPTG